MLSAYNDCNNWVENGKGVKYYPAQSGHDAFQSARYTNVANDGPIPQGDYLLEKGSGQSYNESWYNPLYKINRTLDNLPYARAIKRNWTLKPAAWGHQRIPIQPQSRTNTFGRSSMYVHGGDNGFGSAGCVDLERGMPEFYKDWENYDDDLSLEVKYLKEW